MQSPVQSTRGRWRVNAQHSPWRPRRDVAAKLATHAEGDYCFAEFARAERCRFLFCTDGDLLFLRQNAWAGFRGCSVVLETAGIGVRHY